MSSAPLPEAAGLRGPVSHCHALVSEGFFLRHSQVASVRQEPINDSACATNAQMKLGRKRWEKGVIAIATVRAESPS